MLGILFTGFAGAAAGSTIAVLVARYLRGEPLLRPPRCRSVADGGTSQRNGDACGRTPSQSQDFPHSSLPGNAGASLAGALLCASLAWRFSWSGTALLLCLFFLVLLALSLIDMAELHLPDALLVLAAVPALSLLATGGTAPWPQPLYAALAGSGLLLGLRLVFRLARKKEGLGLGDVKLMVLLGFVTDVPGVFDILFIAAVAGLAVAGLVRLLRGNTPELLPFGPFLCFAAYVKILWGPHVPFIG